MANFRLPFSLFLLATYLATLCDCNIIRDFRLSSLFQKRVDLLRSLGYFSLNEPVKLLSIRRAIVRYQTMWGLQVTGELDVATMTHLDGPRCGDSDKSIVNSPLGEESNQGEHMQETRNKRYNTVSRWDRCTLNYRITGYTTDLTRDQVDATFALAAQYWMKAVDGLQIISNFSQPDIKVFFIDGKHADGSPFDGEGGVLAHAFYPKHGNIHFDLDEKWTVDTEDSAFDLLQVAVHELGHSLGLGHSLDETAVMYPRYRPNWEVQLGQDDIDGISQLFDCGSHDGGTTASPKPCDSDPCLHGGHCMNAALGQFTFICICKVDYTGQNCETKVDGN